MVIDTKNLNTALIQEVETHKWLESQKISQDMGFEKAFEDFLAKHYSDWLSSYLKTVEKQQK